MFTGRSRRPECERQHDFFGAGYPGRSEYELHFDGTRDAKHRTEERPSAFPGSHTQTPDR